MKEIVLTKKALKKSGSKSKPQKKDNGSVVVPQKVNIKKSERSLLKKTCSEKEKYYIPNSLAGKPLKVMRYGKHNSFAHSEELSMGFNNTILMNTTLLPAHLPRPKTNIKTKNTKKRSTSRKEDHSKSRSKSKIKSRPDSRPKPKPKSKSKSKSKVILDFTKLADSVNMNLNMKM